MTRPAVFLDRDGTLVEEVPYLHHPERLALLPGVGALATLAAAGYALVMVTNHAGVAGVTPLFVTTGQAAGRPPRRAWPPSPGWPRRSRRCWRAGPCRAAKRPGPLRP